MKESIFGLHAVKAVLATEPARVKELFIFEGRKEAAVEAIIALAKKNEIPIQFVNKQYFEKHFSEETHQGVVASCTAKTMTQDLWELLDSLSEPAFLLILDGVQDPHNLGACIRTADAAGVHAIIIPKDNSVGITPVVRKVACGATEYVPVFQVTNLARTLKQLQEKGIWIYGLDANGPENIFKIKFQGPVALALGAEGTGLRRLTRENCDILLHIPMKGHVESLNVSVATAICLYEVFKNQ